MLSVPKNMSPAFYVIIPTIYYDIQLECKRVRLVLVDSGLGPVDVQHVDPDSGRGGRGPASAVYHPLCYSPPKVSLKMMMNSEL